MSEYWYVIGPKLKKHAAIPSKVCDVTGSLEIARLELKSPKRGCLKAKHKHQIYKIQLIK